MITVMICVLIFRNLRGKQAKENKQKQLTYTDLKLKKAPSPNSLFIIILLLNFIPSTFIFLLHFLIMSSIVSRLQPSHSPSMSMSLILLHYSCRPPWPHLEPLLPSRLPSFFVPYFKQGVENIPEILVHVTMVASHSCCRFVGSTSVMHIFPFLHILHCQR